ncbi:hypothetical protein L593_13105 [Salinarchaeum sp. Harcht-Bsk1]|uniref:helix-hairpin-helix domain-containing protein n=1 Tax=Salinarchaeum sp. Harcht-Bsk1 TaxID=1333523 RepID=UPI0003424036|nr:helix-hairpin-helix domain-containing protein [Salinarchaeum sp. Harcht-Bsk1]AGN02560.1 hypothetical protein L593_13105 [Salinarchaeum sp. Harcht-Bsk1]
MSIVRKLKSLLGLDEGGSEPERDVTVTVEHDPENEAAVKGADVEESTSGGSHAVAVSGDEDEDEAAAEEETESVADEAETSIEEETGTSVDEEAETGAEEEADTEAAPEDETATAAEDEPDEVEIPDAEEPEAPVDEESDEEEAEATEAAGSSEPVDVLNGIGPAYAERLGDAGVETVGELAAADAAGLAEESDIAEGRIQGWIDQAGEY